MVFLLWRFNRNAFMFWAQAKNQILENLCAVCCFAGQSSPSPHIIYINDVLRVLHRLKLILVLFLNYIKRVYRSPRLKKVHFWYKKRWRVKTSDLSYLRRRCVADKWSVLCTIQIHLHFTNCPYNFVSLFDLVSMMGTLNTIIIFWGHPVFKSNEPDFLETVSSLGYCPLGDLFINRGDFAALQLNLYFSSLYFFVCKYCIILLSILMIW